MLIAARMAARLRPGIPLLLLAALAGACHAEDGVPKDVRDFVARREKCDHFRGEEATDDKRAAFLEAKVKEFCSGTDSQLKALKAKHAGNKAAAKALEGFESNIE